MIRLDYRFRDTVMYPNESTRERVHQSRHNIPRENDPLLRKTLRNGEARSKAWFLILLFSLIVLVLYKNGHSRINATPNLKSSTTSNPDRNKYIRPGDIFYDTQGEPINAHGGGFLRYNDTYYWYGEIKQGKTYLPAANANWGGTRVDFVGISCYASTNLVDWHKCTTYNVLPAVNDDPSHDLHWTKVGERPKVVYNAKTKMFVMWLHVDTMDYQLARCGVATSSSPEGQFSYLGSFRPGGHHRPLASYPGIGATHTEDEQMARDLTVFVDDDTKAYLFTSSENNSVMHISELTGDYLSTTGTYQRIFVGAYVEAPSIFKKDGLYHFIGSGCTAWYPNAARSAVAVSIWGPWILTGNPCRGEEANTTFRSQSTFVIPVSNGRDDFYVFVADRWNMYNLSDSRYVWLPLSFDRTSGLDMIAIWWQDFWTPEDYTT
ncbi:hypothetical protein HJC23_005530 [Cyclotella cryptica]|uniref:Glycosyl hydrolase family 43 protein n=1 Tax=Cyclotella cryptica TaxID=29204 RepID=A0ABD3PX27_9STRA|eukprot:CCRYP_010612-RA/>CCRYP_010612-RA protein AED:0.00 eAED:0.00 QI:377/-1/1/1/-1/1/1/176/433